MKPIPIDSARCFEIEGNVALELTTAGKPWILELQKASLLAAGLVCLPDEMRAYGEAYEVPGVTEEETTPLDNLSADPVVVDLARRLWCGEIEPGEEAQVNTREVAAAARWEIVPERLIFRRKI